MNAQTSSSEYVSQENLIPYPRGAGLLLVRLPLIGYRLGLGGLLNLGRVMVLGTCGRRSGQTRYTAIEYRNHGSKTYVVSAWGERPNWVQNLKTSPEVIMQKGQRSFAGRAEIVTNRGEALRVLHLFRRRAPFVYDPLIARLSARERVNERSLPDISGEITIVRIEPTTAPPTLRPMPIDYAWVAPLLAVLVLAAALLIALTRSRNDT
jgi:deazaflavin-dependent oxidoreductase (nitroreductase family)